MPNIVNSTGGGLNQSPQKHAIYNKITAWPSSVTWEVPVSLGEMQVHEFFENLSLSTEDNGGNSFYYPNPNGENTICRFEWHLSYRNRDADFRVGLIFELKKGETPTNAIGYLQSNESFGDIDARRDRTISNRKFEEFKSRVTEEINLAKCPSNKANTTAYAHIFFFKSPPARPFVKGFSIDGGRIKVFPTKSFEQSNLTGILIRSRGRTHAQSERVARQKFALLLAIGSLVTGSYWKSQYVDRKNVTVWIGRLHKIKLSDEDKIYGSEFGPPLGGGTGFDENLILIIRQITEGFLRAEETEIGNLHEAVFANYGALEAALSNRTISVLGFIAVLSAISKHRIEHCNGDVSCTVCGTRNKHQNVGDRKAISLEVRELLAGFLAPPDDDFDAFDRWLTRVYSKHRSSFIHSANHRFNEYGQDFQNGRGPAAGAPSAIPTPENIVGDQNIFAADFLKLPELTRIALIAKICSTLDLEISNAAFDIPQFQDRYCIEAFIGLPTSGWVQLN